MKENRPNKANHVNVIVIVYVGTHIEWVKRSGGGGVMSVYYVLKLIIPRRNNFNRLLELLYSYIP